MDFDTLYSNYKTTIVMDPGHESFRVGYAYDCYPLGNFPSYVGVCPIDRGNRIRFTCGTVNLYTPYKNKAVERFMKDGMISKWMLFDKAMDYAYRSVLQTDSRSHPLIFVEPPWNHRSKRHTLAEICFEKYGVPAMYLGKSAFLTSLQHDKWTALVVDCGASKTSTTPVLNGRVYSRAICTDPLGGNWLKATTHLYLKAMRVHMFPVALIAHRRVVNMYEPPTYALKNLGFVPTLSWLNYSYEYTLDDFVRAAVRVSPVPYDPRHPVPYDRVAYEFATGHSRLFGHECYILPEPIFKNSAGAGLADMIVCSIDRCDINLQPTLYRNIILTGGLTLLPGFVERLAHDLSQKNPTCTRARIFACDSSMERRYGSFIGASVLATTPVLQQLWCTQAEYNEYGPRQLNKNIPD